MKKSLLILKLTKFSKTLTPVYDNCLVKLLVTLGMILYLFVNDVHHVNRKPVYGTDHNLCHPL